MIINLDNLSAQENVLLNMVSLEIREPYNNLITKLSEQYKDNIDWVVSTIASRNINFSPLFMRCCHLALIKKMVERNHSITAVVVSSRCFGRVIEKYFSQNKLTVKVRYRKVSFNRLKMLWEYFYQILLIIFHFINQIIFSKICFSKGKFDTSRPVTLLEVFILKDSFSSHSYKDRYYPGIHEFLSEEEKQDFYYLPTFLGIRNYYRIFSKVAGCGQKFIPKEHFLKVRDYIFALLYPLRILKKRPRDVAFLDFDITPLIREEIFYKSTNFSSLMGVLNFRLTKRLKECNVRIRLVVDWFENQIIDRGINYGFRRFFPETPLVGYQGYIVSTQYNTYFHPTDFERTSGVIPHEIAVVGRKLIEPTKEFCKDLKVNTAPAFRFKRVWRERRFLPEPHKYAVLISLPMTLKESMEILRLVAGVIKQKDYDNFIFDVKPHPVNHPEKIKSLFGADWPERFKFVTGEFHDCVEKANLLIGNTSSTCMEALAKGIPVIIIGSQSGLTQNPIPENIKEDIWFLCYSAEELTKAILYYANRDEEIIKRHEFIARQIKRDYFEPVTRESVRRFLKLKYL